MKDLNELLKEGLYLAGEDYNNFELRFHEQLEQFYKRRSKMLDKEDEDPSFEREVFIVKEYQNVWGSDPSKKFYKMFITQNPKNFFLRFKTNSSKSSQSPL